MTATPTPNYSPSSTPSVTSSPTSSVTPSLTFLGSAIIESIWQGNKSWTKKLTIQDSNLTNSQEQWSDSIELKDLPGEGTIQASSEYIINDKLHRLIWRNNRNWIMTVPIDTGIVQWDLSSQWLGPFTIEEFPGNGDVQAVGDLATEDFLHRSIWRGGQGWFTTVPIENGNIIWSRANWDGPFSKENLPGEGEIQATSDAYLGNNIRQTYWRNNKGWYRIVPIENGNILWGPYYEWLPIDDIPATDKIYAFSDTDLR